MNSKQLYDWLFENAKAINSKHAICNGKQLMEQFNITASELRSLVKDLEDTYKIRPTYITKKIEDTDYQDFTYITLL